MPLINRIKARLRDGEVVCGFGITMPAPGIAQVLSRSGADFLTIDFEHGSIDLGSAYAIIAATAGSPCIPIARVQTTATWAVEPVLDAGALGVVFPMVRTRADVEAGIAAALYPPRGTRGIAPHYAPSRWNVPSTEYLGAANDAMLKMILVETAEAVHNIHDIVSIPELDVAAIAPGDLAASLGHIGQPQHPEVLEAVRIVEKAVSESKVALGGVARSAEDIRKKIEQRYRFLILGFDVGVIQAASSEMVNAVRTEFSARR